MIISLSAFIAAFTVIVLVHEMGHFLAARKLGVKVYEFSIGFPFSPRLFTLFRNKETAFTVRLLPLGGFVSFSPDSNDDDAELFTISRGKSVVILFAGPLFNIIFAFIIFIPVFLAGEHLGLFSATLLSAQTIWKIFSGTIIFLINIFTGHGTMDGLSGPLGIAVMAGKAASRGILNLCHFMGVLSVSVGIMSLLPIPALDGGQLAMISIESIRRKPISPRVYQVATIAGIALFIIFTAVITCRDVLKLIS